MRSIDYLFIGIGIILVMNLGSIGYFSFIEPKTDWQNDLLIEVNQSPDLLKQIQESDVFDYSNPTVQGIIDDLLAVSMTEKEYVNNVMDYVYVNIDYEILDYASCLQMSGSKALEGGKGDCDIMSIAGVTLLRGAGVPAKMVGGCLWRSDFCGVTQSIMSTFGIDIREPIIQPLGDLEQYYIDGQYIFPRAGGIHAWLEAYLDNEGWVGYESTAGKRIGTSCYSYNIERYPETIYGYCATYDYNYAKWCMEQ